MTPCFGLQLACTLGAFVSRERLDTDDRVGNSFDMQTQILVHASCSFGLAQNMPV